LNGLDDESSEEMNERPGDDETREFNNFMSTRLLGAKKDTVLVILN